MQKLEEEQVRQLVIRMKAGEGSDDEMNRWIEKIYISTGNPDVIHAIMSSNDIAVIMKNLYNFHVIQL